MLAPAQALAIEHASGPIQVLAGPGSGKTYLTIRRIRHLICHHGVSPDKILVITFTKAAAKEMEERFIKLTKGALRGVCFGTFHAVYFHILQKSTYGKGGLLPVSKQEQWNYLKHALMVCGIEDLDREVAGILLKEISHVKHNGGKVGQLKEIENLRVDEKIQENLQTSFPAIYEEYVRVMKEAHKLDFDDMVLLCCQLLEQNEKLRDYWQNTFSYILVDEFQDISPLQYQVLKILAEPENNLFVVGDDDQSIYGFRGAGPDIMKQFLKDYPFARQLILDANYRSTDMIVKAAGLVICENKNRFQKQIQTQNPVGDKVKIHAFSTKEEETKYVLEQLQFLTVQQLSDTAIICRTNIQLAEWSRHLAMARLPFCCKDKVENLFASFIAQDWLAYLKFARDFYAGGHGKRKDFLRIMNKPCRYLQRSALPQDVVDGDELLKYYADKPYMQSIIRRLFGDLRHLAKLCPYLALDCIRKTLGYDVVLGENVSHAERNERMEKANEIQRSAIGYRTYEEWLAYIDTYNEILEKEGVQTSDKGVKLLTMHSSKGLEYDTVFLSGINAKTIPGRKAQTASQIEEERRIFYVAMTRAKRRLEILYDKEPSPFLSQLIKSPYIEQKE